MKFEFFDSMTSAEADNFLQEYVSTERQALEEVRRHVERSGVSVDMTLDSIEPVFGWIAARLRTLARDPDPSLPWWIRETESYQGGLLEFDEASNVLIMSASFYYGETFVHYSPTLSWGVGRGDTALKNMPVVDGFSHRLQLPPILIAENLFIDILSGSKGLEAVGQTVATWRERVDGDLHQRHVRG